jgi:hypothetical protein
MVMRDEDFLDPEAQTDAATGVHQVDALFKTLSDVILDSCTLKPTSAVSLADLEVFRPWYPEYLSVRDAWKDVTAKSS